MTKPLHPTRRAFALGALALGMARPTVAQSRTIRLLVGFPAGGGTDAIARILAEHLKDELGGTPVIVENKPGAGGQLAAQALKTAAPDGTTLFLTHDHTISILPQVVKTPGFDPAHDFVPVAGFATFVNALAVSSGTPAKTFGDYVAHVKAQSGKGNVGVPAPASTPEFLVKVIGEKYHLDLVPVPYRGSAPMMADMLGNQIAAGIGSIPDFIENHKNGKIRVVAVLGGQRQAVMPEVPTFRELGLSGLEDLPYYGVFAPAATPRGTLEAFSAALAKVLAKPAVHERLTAMGLTVGHMSGEQLGQRERAYSAVWARLIRQSGFQPQ